MIETKLQERIISNQLHHFSFLSQFLLTSTNQVRVCRLSCGLTLVLNPSMGVQKVPSVTHNPPFQFTIYQQGLL